MGSLFNQPERGYRTVEVEKIRRASGSPRTATTKEKAMMEINDFEWTEGRKVRDIQTVDECKEAMTTLSLLIANIQSQIDNAKILAASKKEYSDRDWWVKANANVANIRAVRQYLQDMCGRLRRANNAQLSASFDQKLVAALRAYVGEEVFIKIIAQVRWDGSDRIKREAASGT